MLAKGTVGVDDISMLQLIGLFVGLARYCSLHRCWSTGLPWTQLIYYNWILATDLLCMRYYALCLNDALQMNFCNQHAVSSFQPINNFVANSLQPRSKFCALTDLLVPVVHR